MIMFRYHGGNILFTAEEIADLIRRNPPCAAHIYPGGHLGRNMGALNYLEARRPGSLTWEQVSMVVGRDDDERRVVVVLSTLEGGPLTVDGERLKFHADDYAPCPRGATPALKRQEQA